MTDQTSGERFIAALKGKHPSRDTRYGMIFQIGDVEVILKHNPRESNGRDVELHSIISGRKSQGQGSAVLSGLTRLADQYDIILSLYARAMDGKPTSTKRCVEWYRRHGFTMENARNDNWQPYVDGAEADHIGADMWREPLAHKGEAHG